MTPVSFRERHQGRLLLPCRLIVCTTGRVAPQLKQSPPPMATSASDISWPTCQICQNLIYEGKSCFVPVRAQVQGLHVNINQYICRSTASVQQVNNPSHLYYHKSSPSPFSVTPFPTSLCCHEKQYFIYRYRRHTRGPKHCPRFAHSLSFPVTSLINGDL